MDVELSQHLRAREKVQTRVFDDSSYASTFVAQQIAELVRETCKAGMDVMETARRDVTVRLSLELHRELSLVRLAGRRCVLGLATGSTPMQVYRELVREHRQAGLSFRHVVTFNLDEYYPMSTSALQSYHRFMWEHLFGNIDIDPANVHIPSGEISTSGVARYAPPMIGPACQTKVPEAN